MATSTTLFFSRFADVMVTVHPAIDRDVHLVFSWTLTKDGWDQSAPIEAESLASAMELRPAGARAADVPPDFAAGAWWAS